jgi:hypothetical protein
MGKYKRVVGYRRRGAMRRKWRVEEERWKCEKKE